jgi:hypothetical protein
MQAPVRTLGEKAMQTVASGPPPHAEKRCYTTESASETAACVGLVRTTRTLQQAQRCAQSHDFPPAADHRPRPSPKVDFAGGRTCGKQIACCDGTYYMGCPTPEYTHQSFQLTHLGKHTLAQSVRAPLCQHARGTRTGS